MLVPRFSIYMSQIAQSIRALLILDYRMAHLLGTTLSWVKQLTNSLKLALFKIPSTTLFKQIVVDNSYSNATLKA